MGTYKQKMLEEMEDEDYTDEYGAFMDNDEAEWDFEDFEDKCEDDLIERSIEDEAIEADIKRQDDAIKQKMLEEMDRNSKAEERMSEIIAREDEVGFKESDFVNTELVEVVQDLQNKKSGGNKDE